MLLLIPRKRLKAWFGKGIYFLMPLRITPGYILGLSYGEKTL
jgi:hypothetical protein